MAAPQLNIEYFFRLLYDCLRGACTGGIGYARLETLLSHVWLIITIVGYLLAALALFVIIYALVRLSALREEEKKYYGTLIGEAATAPANGRWQHIESLVSEKDPSKWREAIIEADIMLDDLLTKQGYAGTSVGEKLKQVEPSDFNTLSEAWEAHKVRNQIAHEGSAFDLSDTLANRTIARYQAVFCEFDLI